MPQLDLNAAYEILGVSRSANLDEVKTAYRHLARKYHPDAGSSSDTQKFILLGAAYSFICDALTGKTDKAASEIAVPEDVVIASGISQQLDGRFARIEEDYAAYRDRLVASTEAYIFDRVSSASSGSNLKTLVERSIGQTWSEMVKQMEDYVASLINAAADRDKEFLNQLFSDLYDARREYWVHSLYHNSVVLGGILITLLLAIVSHLPTAADISPWLVAIRDTTWIQFAPLQVVVVYVAIKLWQLNPKRQFVPPRLSVAGIHAEIREVAGGIGLSVQESTAGGAAAGLLAGAYLAHPLIGLAAGVLIGLFGGEDLDAMKERVKTDLKQRLEFGVQQLNDRIMAWIHRQKADILGKTRESFRQNFARVTRFLIESKSLGNRLLTSSKLLLEGPTTASTTISNTLLAPSRSGLPAAVSSATATPGKQGSSLHQDAQKPHSGLVSRVNTGLVVIGVLVFGVPLLLTIPRGFNGNSEPSPAPQSYPGEAYSSGTASTAAAPEATHKEVVPSKPKTGAAQTDAQLPDRKQTVKQGKGNARPASRGKSATMPNETAASAATSNQPMIGWSADQIATVMGEPDRRAGNTWWYGDVRYVFRGGKLVAILNPRAQ